jgi:hypothetical protein
MTPIVQVSNTFRPLVDYLQEEYGGRVWFNKEKRPNRKPCYLWSVAGQKALVVIHRVYKYLWIKRGQADLVLEFYQHVGMGIDPDEVARRTVLFKKIRELNFRGNRRLKVVA